MNRAIADIWAFPVGALALGSELLTLKYEYRENSVEICNEREML